MTALIFISVKHWFLVQVVNVFILLKFTKLGKLLGLQISIRATLIMLENLGMVLFGVAPKTGQFCSQLLYIVSKHYYACGIPMEIMK